MIFKKWPDKDISFLRIVKVFPKENADLVKWGPVILITWFGYMVIIGFTTKNRMGGRGA